MISESRIRELIIQALQRIQDSGIADANFAVNDDTVVLGMGSPVDSIAFVTLISDLEQSIERELGREFVIVMQEIHDLHEGTELLVSDLAKHLAHIAAQ